MACEILLPNQGLNLCSLHWALRALTTGLPRNSEAEFFEGLDSPHNTTNLVDESNRRLDIAEERITDLEHRDMKKYPECAMYRKEDGINGREFKKRRKSEKI